jgi:hypothetical protein
VITESSRNPFILTLAPAVVTFSPRKIARSAATVSRICVTGFWNGTPIHCSTIFGVEIPRPSTNRPFASSLVVTADIAINGAGRVNTGIMAQPKRIFSVSIAAAAIGAKASLENDSYDHASV